MYNERAQVAASALAHKVPTISAPAEHVRYGVLLSYGPDFPMISAARSAMSTRS